MLTSGVSPPPKNNQLLNVFQRLSMSFNVLQAFRRPRNGSQRPRYFNPVRSTRTGGADGPCGRVARPSGYDYSCHKQGADHEARPEGGDACSTEVRSRQPPSSLRCAPPPATAGHGMTPYIRISAGSGARSAAPEDSTSANLPAADKKRR